MKDGDECVFELLIIIYNHNYTVGMNHTEYVYWALLKRRGYGLLTPHWVLSANQNGDVSGVFQVTFRTYSFICSTELPHQPKGEEEPALLPLLLLPGSSRRSFLSDSSRGPAGGGIWSVGDVLFQDF